MGRNHRPFSWPLRRFTVVEDSMRPALRPGDGLLALRCGTPRPGQLRVFRDPLLSTRWLIKRVGEVRRAGSSTTFEARSENPGVPGAMDSREFGWVAAADTYRVVWVVRRKVDR